MRLAPFLLDEWIRRKYSSDPPIEFDLASSTGPVWTYRELLALEDGLAENLLDTPLFYTNPRGAPELREEIARMQGVDPEHVQIVTGSSEALLAMFYFAAEPGANIVLPYPEFPAYTAMAESLGIELLYLPGYSPNLNLIERLWRFVRKESLNSTYYEAFEQFATALDECRDGLSTAHKGEMETLMTHKFQMFGDVPLLAA